MSDANELWTDDLLPEQVGPYEEIQTFWNNFVETCHANKNTCLNFYQVSLSSKKCLQKIKATIVTYFCDF